MAKFSCDFIKALGQGWSFSEPELPSTTTIEHKWLQKLGFPAELLVFINKFSLELQKQSSDWLIAL